MNLLRLIICFFMALTECNNAFAQTPWEHWLSKPSSKTAKLVQTVEYTNSHALLDTGAVLTHDLRTLAQRINSGNSDAIRIAVRLTTTTSPGANLEDLYVMLGSAVRDMPVAYLTALSNEQSNEPCPGVAFFGDAFVDNDSARKNERQKRKKALSSVTRKSLIPERDQCLRVLASDS